MLSLITIALSIGFVSAGYNVYPKFQSYAVGHNFGDALFLTPYIENNRTTEGREAAMVKPLKKNIKSYAGYITVNKEFNSNMFFWFFPSAYNWTSDPVIVWLQGGPGASSLFGLFAEHGPYAITEDSLDVTIRKYYWSQTMNVIYIDNPVGTGFSFTENDKGFSTNESEVGENLYSVLKQFFQLFPELKTNDFFVTGESYGGKYVPALAYTIHNKNLQSIDKINLKGLAIGNGLCDPENMMDYADYLSQIGLLDDNEKELFIEKQNEIVTAIKNKKYDEAFDLFDILLNGDLTPYKSLFYNSTGYTFYFNYLHEKDYQVGDMGKFLSQEYVRRAIHVANYSFNDGSKDVEKHLKSDVMQSIKPWFQVLIDNYKVLTYNGQLDIIVAYPLTVSFLKTVKWSGAEEYKTAQRSKIYSSTGELIGYAKTVKDFTEVLVRNAGHMVPSDQPQWALELIDTFVRGKKFNSRKPNQH